MNYKHELLVERDELTVRIRNLEEFIACSNPYIRMEEKEQEAAKKQLKAMQVYMEAIRERIGFAVEKIHKANVDSLLEKYEYLFG